MNNITQNSPVSLDNYNIKNFTYNNRNITIIGVPDAASYRYRTDIYNKFLKSYLDNKFTTDNSRPVTGVFLTSAITQFPASEDGIDITNTLIERSFWDKNACTFSLLSKYCPLKDHIGYGGNDRIKHVPHAGMGFENLAYLEHKDVSARIDGVFTGREVEGRSFIFITAVLFGLNVATKYIQGMRRFMAMMAAFMLNEWRHSVFIPSKFKSWFTIPSNLPEITSSWSNTLWMLAMQQISAAVVPLVYCLDAVMSLRLHFTVKMPIITYRFLFQMERLFTGVLATAFLWGVSLLPPAVLFYLQISVGIVLATQLYIALLSVLPLSIQEYLSWTVPSVLRTLQLRSLNVAANFVKKYANRISSNNRTLNSGLSAAPSQANIEEEMDSINTIAEGIDTFIPDIDEKKLIAAPALVRTQSMQTPFYNADQLNAEKLEVDVLYLAPIEKAFLKARVHSWINKLLPQKNGAEFFLKDDRTFIQKILGVLVIASSSMAAGIKSSIYEKYVPEYLRKQISVLQAMGIRFSELAYNFMKNRWADLQSCYNRISGYSSECYVYFVRFIPDVIKNPFNQASDAIKRNTITFFENVRLFAISRWNDFFTTFSYLGWKNFLGENLDKQNFERLSSAPDMIVILPIQYACGPVGLIAELEKELINRRNSEKHKDDAFQSIGKPDAPKSLIFKIRNSASTLWNTLKYI